MDLRLLDGSVPPPPILSCGSATLTLYARRYQTSPGTPLVPDDPDSAHYVQHGTTDLQVVREPVTWKPGASPEVPMSLAGWTVTGLDLGPPSSGSGVRDVLYATMRDSTNSSVSPVIRRVSWPGPSSDPIDARQFAGVDQDGNIALHFRYMDSMADWVFCEPSDSKLMMCAAATPAFQGAPPQSIAVDAKGKWLVSVDSRGTLRIQGYSYTPSTKAFQVQMPLALPVGNPAPTFRQAVVGDLDLDGDADVLAWRDSPLVLLLDKDKDNKPFSRLADSERTTKFIKDLTTLVADSVIAISHEPCDRRPRLLVAAKNTVNAYVIGPDWTLGEPETVVTVTDPITALLRKDTDNDGVADRLIVATQPASGLPQILVFKPASTP